ncbi:hypothetical protein C8R43DRAFT_1234592 [Mycena crocata]|nr:hypothetical protein C8R43DRAFT_1234592 [Mycena crocata]
MIPQELIDAIVDDVDDTDALKSCALAASVLRPTSQRKLFNSLTLADKPPVPPFLILGDSAQNRIAPTPGDWCGRLTESPYIAPYITALTIRLRGMVAVGTGSPDPSVIDDFQQVVGRLVKLRRCTLRGSHQSWRSISAIGDTVFHSKSVFQLHLLFIDDLPPSVLTRLLSTARNLSFHYVSVASHEEVTTTPVPTRSDSTSLLLLSHRTDGVCDFLIRPECRPYTANIRKLGLASGGEMNYTAMTASATTLEYLRFDCLHGSTILPLPPLPALRLIDIVLRHNQENLLVEIFSTLLASGSAPENLEEMVVSFAATTDPAFALAPEVLAGLEQVMANSATSPRIRWRLDFLSNWKEQARRSFIASVQGGLASLHEQGRLIVEGYSCKQIREEWSIQ